ncbi:hypothetical protein PENSPDRAFT_239975 [Peniophora sp. CONT]|nr:hypothetical protein PENSPDRAFT_239975 [Peniophora sp. CONT]
MGAEPCSDVFGLANTGYIYPDESRQTTRLRRAKTTPKRYCTFNACSVYSQSGTYWPSEGSQWRAHTTVRSRSWSATIRVLGCERTSIIGVTNVRWGGTIGIRPSEKSIQPVDEACSARMRKAILEVRNVGTLSEYVYHFKALIKVTDLFRS